MKKTSVILIISFILIIVLLPNFSMAASFMTEQTDGGGTPRTTTEDTLGLGDLDNYKGEEETSEKFKEKANVIVGVIQNVGVVLSVIILSAIGIKYLLGSI